MEKVLIRNYDRKTDDETWDGFISYYKGKTLVALVPKKL